MADLDPTNHVFIDRTVEAVIRIAVIAALVGWCFIIAKPFLAPILGSAIIAVTVFRVIRCSRLRLAVDDSQPLCWLPSSCL